MKARVITAQVNPDKLDEFSRKWTEVIAAGLQGQSVRPRKIYLNADRSTGKILTYGVLDQGLDDEAFNQTFPQIMAQLSEFIAERPNVEVFEVLQEVEFS